MPYRLIKGEFHIHYPDQPRTGPEPDGDTLKFKPDNPLLVESLRSAGGTTGPRFNRRGMINLRFEGIDALETHFDGMHQNLQWATAARDFMLEMAGFRQIEFFDDLPYKVKSVVDHPQRGYVLSNGLDGHGRVVAFVYSGDHPLPDGTEIWLEGDLLRESFNAHLLESGLVYPTFYTTLPISLKELMAVMTATARFARRGLWPEALGVGQPVIINRLADLEDLVIWPKLFRRLARYFAGGFTSLDQFDTWLRADPKDRDDALILPDRELGNMHDVVTAIGNQIEMVYEPEDLIILPDDATTVIVAPPPPVVAPTPAIEQGSLRIIAALVNPIGADRGNETITLMNISPDEIDLAGLELTDRSNRRMPLTGVLPAGGVLQVTLSVLSLNNTGDDIFLRDASGEVIHSVTYAKEQAKLAGWTLTF